MAIDFKPEQNDYINLTPFKTWLLYQINTWGVNNFPFLENDFDQLTNYGMMMKLMKAMNDTISNQNKVEEDMSKLYEAFTELQTYIDNYFENLDVQEEINNKLDEMAQSGELTNLIKNYIDPIYESYEQRINEQISIQDSKIKSVENQIKGVSSIPPTPVSDINQMTDTNKFYLLTTDGYIYYYNGTSWIRGWLYQSNEIEDNSIDSSMLKANILKGQDMSYLLSEYNINSLNHTDSSFLGLYVSGNVSDNGYNRMSNFNYLTFSKNPVFKLTPLAKLSNVSYFVNVYRTRTKASNSLDFTSLNLEIGGISNEGVLNNNRYNLRTNDFITVEEETVIEPDVNQYFTWCFKYNLDGTFIERYAFNENNLSYTITSSYKYKLVFKPVPSTVDLTNTSSYYINAIKTSIITEMIEQVQNEWYNDNLSYNNNDNYLFKVCLRRSTGSIAFPIDAELSSYLLISDDLTTPLQNKKISVLGDSMSAYTGIIPQANIPYYTGSNSGVTKYRQMWWQKLIDNNGSNREIIQASSGSNVSFLRNQTLALSNDNMCEALGNPDIIIILGGANDYSHTPALLGDFNGTQDFPTTNLNFSDAYALMLSRVLANYPNATVFCCGIPLFVRTNLNKAQCERNTETDNQHKTIFDYSEKIRQIAEIMNCQYIDMNECGFNRENYYPTYCQDSSTNSTHPNSKGQEVIYKVIEKKVIDVMNNLK